MDEQTTNETAVIPGLAAAFEAVQQVVDDLELDLQPTEVFALAEAAVLALREPPRDG
jgi:hypothetical protein